jgi:hypothetical protein
MRTDVLSRGRIGVVVRRRVSSYGIRPFWRVHGDDTDSVKASTHAGGCDLFDSGFDYEQGRRASLKD